MTTAVIVDAVVVERSADHGDDRHPPIAQPAVHVLAGSAHSNPLSRTLSQPGGHGEVRRPCPGALVAGLDGGPGPAPVGCRRSGPAGNGPPELEGDRP